MKNTAKIAQFTGIQRAVEKAGSQKKLAVVLGVSQQYISQALRDGYVSPHRAVEIEAEFGIPRKQLVKPELVQLLDLAACGC